nr:glucosaminidase domain-containing protein [Bacteroidota bacterium]
SLPDGHKQFILDFYPKIVEANNKVLADHDKIKDLRSSYQKVSGKESQLAWLNKVAGKYKFGQDMFKPNLSKDEFERLIDTLLFRVDIIPGKMVMAQAIAESGWGQSNFAKEINNYFGIHCYTPGCGQPPSGVEDPDFWVKSFPTIEKCIEAYLWTLNCGHAYVYLRTIRKDLRSTDEYPDALKMVDGLKRYSQIGNEYITLLTSIIKDYLPSNLDAFVKYSKNSTEEDISLNQ